MVFADEDSPVYMMGAFDFDGGACWRTSPRSRRPSGPATVSAGATRPAACSAPPRASSGRATEQSRPELAAGARRCRGQAERGAKVADVGCGHGCSTVLMAKAFPKSQFVGFDFHPGSIEEARRRMRESMA